jgi:putative oxidoreductase
MINLNPCKEWMHKHADVLMDMIRIYLGVALFFKGVFFMSHRDYLIQLMNDAGSRWFAPAAMAHYIVPAHLVGGLMLIAGLLTRVAALAQLPILIGAVGYLHLPRLMVMDVEARQNFELSALVLFLTLLVFLHGSGRFSLDHLMSRSASHEPPGVPKAA